MPRTVFVSYARKDSDRIQPAVALLEAGGAEVFRDIDDIEFGDDWEAVITRQLQECERVMVFWSANAQASEWVGREYTLALAQQKRMVPVLLDSTPLPPELSKYHALTNFMSRRPAWKKYGGWVVSGAVLTVLAGVVALTTLEDSAPSHQGEPLVVESVDIPPEAILEQPHPAPAMRPAPLSSGDDSISESQEEVAPPDPVSPEQAIEQAPLPPVFAWGAGLLSLLLLFLFWLRSRSDAALNDAGRQFVELVFDEK